MSPARVLIIGAGVGGLALAQGLQRLQIEVAVFERDLVLDSRLQGYRLKIFGEFQKKLRDLLCDDAWAEFLSSCAETNLGETTINAPDAHIIASRQGYLPKGGSMPYVIDRGMLRQSMIKGIEKSVHFGKRFVKYELTDTGVRVFFEDGSSEEGTLLIGADGARSRVRKQLLPEFKVLDTDSCCIYGKTILRPEFLARFPEKHRRWMIVIVDQTPALQNIISGEAPVSLVGEQVRFVNRDNNKSLPEDYIHWGLLFDTNTSGLKGEELDDSLRNDAVAMSLRLTSEWDPSIRSLLELQEPSLTMGMRIYSSSPQIPTWTPSSKVTVLGDAIHVMSPAGGVGAVATLHDAAALAGIIGEMGVTQESIGKFEEVMRKFAGVCLQRSFVGASKLVGTPLPDACKTVDW